MGRILLSNTVHTELWHISTHESTVNMKHTGVALCFNTLPCLFYTHLEWCQSWDLTIKWGQEMDTHLSVSQHIQTYSDLFHLYTSAHLFLQADLIAGHFFLQHWLLTSQEYYNPLVHSACFHWNRDIILEAVFTNLFLGLSNWSQCTSLNFKWILQTEIE